ncbi:hypothetical protein [Amycolatopsis regifaucium]|uniref:hypothetical protein n=1 Tax=Amycolatopsis regifaucium TaxID=546365 RepID=UPI0008F6287D|nr:hypothetical protein [Amycolatopsis regifaucium]SFH50219.1 hypothetical protein SAMN04489731_104505 [Amycolatopsis regifaucium]
MSSKGLGNRPAAGERNRQAAEAPPRPLGALLLHLELAGWLDRYVDRLVRVDTKTSDALTEDQRVDLMVGLSNAAEALRSSERCDHESAERMLRSALGLIEGVDLDRFALAAP